MAEKKMTVRETEHLNLGAEFGMVTCKDCPSSFNELILLRIHKGYGKSAEELTAQEEKQIYNTANNHRKDHDVRVIFGHKT